MLSSIAHPWSGPLLLKTVRYRKLWSQKFGDHFKKLVIYLVPFTFGFCGLFVVVVVVCLFSMGGVQMWLPTVMGNWPVHAIFFCSLLRLLYYLCSFSLFSLPLSRFFSLFLTQALPKVLPAWLRTVCTASQANIIKKKSFSVGVRWNHYLRFCALNVEGSTISKDFLPTQVHRSVCCPSCRLCCSTFKWGAQEIFVYVFFTAFTLLKFYFRGSSSAPCSIPPLTSPWPKMFFALSLIVLSWKFPVRHHGSFHVQ